MCHRFSGGLDAFDAKIRKAAEEESLPPFAFTTDGKVGATWDAHRLIWKASTVPPTSSGAPEGAPSGHTPSIQSRVAERLYRDFHSKSIDLSDRAKLATAAKEEGVFASKEEALKWLNSDDGEYEVGQAVMVGKMNGVESIPFYMVQVR